MIVDVAWRYLGARRSEGFVSVIAGFSLFGIALGVGTLIVVMAIMNGFRADLVGRLLGLNGHVTVAARDGQGVDLATGILAHLENVRGVDSATPVVEAFGLAAAAGRSTGISFRGMRPVDIAAQPILADAILEGSAEALVGKTAIIGTRLAERLGIGIGDSLTVVSPRGRVTPFGRVPRRVEVSVVGVFELGLHEQDGALVFLPLDLAQILLSLGNRANAVTLLTADADQARAIAVRVLGTLDPNTYAVRDWRQQQSGFLATLDIQQNVLFLILGLMIVVAAFNIVAGIIMLVHDKRRAIAILRTMGASRTQVMGVFLLCGSLIGIIGTGVGVAGGVAFASNIEAIRQGIEGLTGVNLFNPQVYFLSHLPARVTADAVIGTAAMAIGLSVVATLYPAWRAARLEPVELLRD